MLSIQFFEKPNEAIRNRIDTPSTHSTTLPNIASQFFEKLHMAIRSKAHDPASLTPCFYNNTQHLVLKKPHVAIRNFTDSKKQDT